MRLAKCGQKLAIIARLDIVVGGSVRNEFNCNPFTQQYFTSVPNLSILLILNCQFSLLTNFSVPKWVTINEDKNNV